MKILHLMLACSYNDNYNYQENILPKYNQLAGNEVKIIASTEIFQGVDILGYTHAGSYKNEHGIEVVRLEYKKYLLTQISRKIRAYKNLYDEIDSFMPDVIFMHGMQTMDILKVVKYKKAHPKVKVYADSHEDYTNSAKNSLSKNILHKLFYKTLITYSIKYIQKIFYITSETKDFLTDLYNIPEDMLEFYPLGGIIFEDDKYQDIRERYRKELKIPPNGILIMHSGKLAPLKRTKELLNAFQKIEDPNMYLAIIGTIEENYKLEILPLIKNNPRIIFLGWKTGSELLKYLCAADIYAQPGSQSATMQNAMCCGCAIMLTPTKSHKFLLGSAALYIESEDDIKNTLKYISGYPDLLANKKKEIVQIARDKLNYERLANRITED